MSSSIISMLSSQLDDNTIKQISQQLGVNEQSVEQGISAGLPVLLGALDRNTSSPKGAKALTRELRRKHTGGILDHVASALTDESVLQDGSKILGHVLGNRQNNVANGVSKISGLSQDQTAQLLQMLAPLVLGALGKKQQEENLSSQQVANVIHQERQEAESSLSGLSRLLDMDQDGDITDDVINLGAKLLGSFLRGRK